MKIPACILVLIIVQFSAAFQEETTDSLESYSDPDNPEFYSAFSRPIRNDAFLRFGRNHFSEEETNEIPTFLENFARPTRSGGEGLKNNELFVRFGRSKDDIFSRLGIPHTQMNPLDQPRSTRQNSEYLRFGRSIQKKEEQNTAQKIRAKRDVVIPESLKRKDNFLRFGRNSNFMRFGRNSNHNKFPYYFPKNGQNGINLARLLKKLEYDGYLKNHDIQ